MALSISCTFSKPEPSDVRAYQWKLAKWNAENPDNKVSTASDLCEQILLAEVADWKKFEARDNADLAAAKLAWENATDKQRAAALAALQGE